MSVSDRLSRLGRGVRFRDGEELRRRRVKHSLKFVAEVAPLEPRCLLSGVVGGGHSAEAEAHHEAVVEHRTELRIAAIQRREAVVEHRAGLTLASLERREAALQGRAPFQVAAIQRREAVIIHRTALTLAALERREDALRGQGGGGLGSNPPIVGIITAPESEPPAWAAMPAPTSQGDQNAVMHVTTIEKAVTITNEYDQTIYPVFSATNEFSNDGKRYDPYDNGHEEYRLYVGYTKDGKNYAGLPAGQSVTFNIPQALWDGGRIDFVTDTPQTEKSFYASGNPFNFDPKALTYVQTLQGDGVLLQYHSTDPDPKGISVAAASQVAEYTIRDQSTTPTIPDSVDLDVQYIDSTFLPIAMEAVLPGTNPREAGYIGTTNSVANFQATLQKFVQGNGNLNGYFGTKGWPEVYLSDTGQIDPNGLVKIPGAFNIFELSSVPSPLNSSIPFLTSSQTNGNMPGSPADAPNYAAQEISNLVFSWAKFYQQMWADHKAMPGAYLPPTPQLQSVLTTGLEQAGVQTYDIKTSGPADLKRAKEFATTLWYALWAFSQDPGLNTNVRYISATGTTTKGSNMLTGLPASTVAQLQNVMGVVGPNLPVRDQVNNPSPPAPGATSIQMSQPATADGTAIYRFYYDTLPANKGGAPPLQATSQLIAFVLGDNIGDLANVPGFRSAANRQKFTENTIIPLMQGVPSPAYPKSDWYPTPGNPREATEAKYNIDPLVWLIHVGTNWPPANKEVLAYAFSVDDGVGNITVNEAHDFQVDVGGSKGLTNNYPYSQ